MIWFLIIDSGLIWTAKTLLWIYSVATKFLPRTKELRMPTFVFCLQSGFTVTDQLPLTVEKYKEITIDPWDYVLNITAHFDDGTVIDNTTNPKSWRIRNMYTVYHGRCLSFRLKEKVWRICLNLLLTIACK